MHFEKVHCADDTLLIATSTQAANNLSHEHVITCLWMLRIDGPGPGRISREPY